MIAAVSSFSASPPVLIAPDAAHAEEFRAMAAEYLAIGDVRYHRAAQDVGAFVRACEDAAAGRDLPPGWVVQETFWMMRDGHLVGCSRLRPQIHGAVAYEGGHIGYDVRPSKRGKGYGTLLLRLTLAQARRAGLSEVLVTADDANPISCAVIERNGGRREAGVHRRASGVEFRRYWLTT